MANQLAGESSPYLLLHQDNPVQWYPWGARALAKAREEDKPIFLSIGYSACHWCHVMEQESFQDEVIAALLNDRFVCIKVDREERPDLDQIYMHAVQLMTGRGGWPMSVFLTPELEPFYGGTYWPPRARQGMPGFDQVIRAVHDAWENHRPQVLEQSGELTRHLKQLARAPEATGGIDPQLLRAAAAQLEQRFDFAHGGFGRAPKFPRPMDLQLLLRIWRRWPRPGLVEMVQLTLDKMAQGGIYDHLAGGFARYSVDERWLVPHFEKMLYDNALLAAAYLDGYLVTGEPSYARVARQTLDYVLNYMTDEQGGFHSTEDADSEQQEGKFYLWTPQEIREVLGDAPAERFSYVYDVTDAGNFEGKNILNLPKSVEQCALLRGWDREALEKELARSRAKLLQARDQRVRPAKDDKILVGWNALMIDAMARAAAVLDDPKYLEAAARAADFIREYLRRADGRLLHTWRRGRAKLDAYLDDYASLIYALVTLYEADFQARWIDEAVRLADLLLDHFADPDGGGFLYTADDHEPLIARNKDLQDSSVPSGNAMAAAGLLRLGRLCGRDDYLVAARRTVQTAAGLMKHSPMTTGGMLSAADMLLGPACQIVILGDPREAETARILSALRRRYLPNCVVACRSPSHRLDGPDPLQPVFAGKEADASLPTVFLCENATCRAPVCGTQAILKTWDELAKTALP